MVDVVMTRHLRMGLLALLLLWPLGALGLVRTAAAQPEPTCTLCGAKLPPHHKTWGRYSYCDRCFQKGFGCDRCGRLPPVGKMGLTKWIDYRGHKYCESCYEQVKAEEATAREQGHPAPAGDEDRGAATPPTEPDRVGTLGRWTLARIVVGVFTTLLVVVGAVFVMRSRRG